MSLQRGSRLGAYEIVEPLGAGGMGEVYRAHDSKLGRSVAIKVLNLTTVANPQAVRRFELEARAASALNHPGIVTIHDTGQTDGRFYIVMELVDGTTLRQLLRRGAPNLKRALHLAGQLAMALAKAHDSGVVHRDLKPENVMVTDEGHVKIVDFGLAKLAEPLESSDKSATQSGQGVLLGTVGYMAPEQVRGEAADFRADQFALGAILYELVTGSRAFHRGTTVETLSMILNEEPPPALRATPALPLPLIWTIDRCLSKEPAGRYASTRDLAREIETVRDHLAELVPIEKPRLRTSRRAAIATMVLVAALVAGAIYIVVRASASTQARAPEFTRLTFGRGHVSNARFAPDGQTVFYAAAWGDTPMQVFETRPTGPESRAVGPQSAGLASISSTGELALILGCRLDWANCVGTLARMPQGGGAPREILENVVSADWTPDGQSLAAIQAIEGEYQLHFPPGKTLYTATRRLGFLRFAPSGDRLAFLEYPVVSEEEGVLKVVDLQGRAATVSAGWEQVRDIAWSPDGGEIWVSGSERTRAAAIYAVSLAGARRIVLQVPGALHLQDLTRDGRGLVAQGVARAHIVWSGEPVQRELSWLDWSTVADLSADGKTILFYEWGDAVSARPAVYLRTTSGSDAIRLGDGKALALSPEGRWALAIQESPAPHLVLLPTGAGEVRALPPAGLTDFYWARWFPDGQRLLVVGEDANRSPGSYIQYLDTGRLEPIAEKGLLAVLVSPDGRRVLVHDPLEGYLVWPLDGVKPTVVQGLDSRDRPVQWSADGRFLYVRGPEETVVRLHRFDLANGSKELLKELAPRDPSGVVGVATGRGELAVTPDGKSFAFTYWTFLRDLFLVDGLLQ